MQKLGLPSMKSLDRFKTLSSVSGAPKTFSLSSRPPPDSISLGSFTNLKLTAEKLVKEQASVKTDLEMANSKLKKSMEHISVLEEKLQNAFNENAKLKVKQKEDEKLWKGLESKFSSTKTLCDQLTETLQHLASQVQKAEKDKEFFEGKLSQSSKAIDSLNEHMDGLSLKLSSAEETIRNRRKEIEELKFEKEENDRFYNDEQCKTTNLIEEKDALIKKFEATVAMNKQAAESLNSKIGEVQLELRSKEDEIKCLLTTQENLEKRKSDLLLSNNEFAKKLSISLLEIKHLEGFVAVLAVQLVELDKQNLTFTDKFDELNSLYDTCFHLVQQERDLAVKHSQKKYEQLHDRFLYITSERDALQLVNQELKSKIIELQKAQESVMAQLSEECNLAGERIQKLESEAESLVSKKIETEKLVSKLEEKIDTLSESLRSSENKMQDLLLKMSALEMENRDNTEKMQAEIQGKIEEIANLEKECEKHEVQLDSLEKHVSQLQVMLEEKEQLILQYKERETKLEDQISENQAKLTAAESKLVEARKQYDMMLESNQLELSRHLKEISQRNDQAINDIRRKYDLEKQEIVKLEKEKADKVVEEMEQKCDQKVAECKEELRLHLLRIQEENAALVTCLQQEHDRKELNLKADNHEELKRAQLQAENEFREKTTSLRNEHEVQMKALRCLFEDECRKLQEELSLQKSKEDRQRALLQLQWKVMGDKPQEEQEVNSKKDYSISSIKKRDSGVSKRTQHALARPENGEKESPSPGATQTPVSKLLKKVENANTGSVMSIPKHHKKVTHHEYEVETSNGRTITKRRKTRTVLFEDPRKHKKVRTPKVNTPRSFVKGTKGSHPNASNIGDLFSEGSLNPYADDPYAFD
ncbi:synaptonemal complex protein 1-like isoform X2 [Durio zibethinus]|uniref:Synaptonemal complex protein 1-like isoform X2 n=1 Tax=Durio zibethinus TaxID=66656 RepID=A0A6P6B7K1_DURZI|nr:synaptonemal complex protein 1-like isoform X2 [Durio zibethinus]